jgi:hypothetical protein
MDMNAQNEHPSIRGQGQKANEGLAAHQPAFAGIVGAPFRICFQGAAHPPDMVELLDQKGK